MIAAAEHQTIGSDPRRLHELARTCAGSPQPPGARPAAAGPGSTNVTGISASTYAKLRRALGLPEGRVRVVEPFMMLATWTTTCATLWHRHGGLRLPKTFFGFVNENWQPWTMFDSTEVLVAEKFNVRELKRGYASVPQGRHQRPAQRAHATGRLLFRRDRTPATVDWEHLNR